MSTALGYRAFGGPEKQEFIERPVPAPGPGEVAVGVSVAGVNPIDHHLRSGHVTDLNGHVPFPQVLGIEAAGTVTAVGVDVTDLAVGDRVFGLALTGAGTYTTDTVLAAAATGRTPDALSDAWAATIPVAGTTALDALDQLDLPAGATLLVNGVGGGVGLGVAQLARARGITVVGTAGPSKADLVAAVGATYVDYTAGEVVGRLRDLVPHGVDGIVDLVGGRHLRGVAVLAKEPATVVAVNDPSVTEIGGRPVERHLDRPTLERVAGLMVQGRLDPTISGTFPLRRAGEALALVEGGHARGKLVIDVAA